MSEEVRLKSIALPAEHGGWGMLAEPILLGLLVAPSWAGLGIGLAAVFAFLARHPLKIALGDRRLGRRAARTALAERFALGYAAIALAFLLPAAAGATGWWVPLAAAAPLGAVQLAHDVRNRGRHLLPELLGGVALGSVAAAEVRAGGWSLAAALVAWAVMALKAVAAILYVRARLRCDRGLEFGRAAVIVIHVLGIAGALVLAAQGRLPWLAAAAFAVLLARAVHGLSRFHRRVRPQAVGFLEMAYGLGFVLTTAAGYLIGC
ncbi:MAG TPA: YwiC-like family protein [Vicinamibacteria bacterium]|nr:YwiC-like family protein [Vicinamibacteria bacterium]